MKWITAILAPQRCGYSAATSNLISKWIWIPELALVFLSRWHAEGDTLSTACICRDLHVGCLVYQQFKCVDPILPGSSTAEEKHLEISSAQDVCVTFLSEA